MSLNLGSQISMLRKAKGMTQEQLACAVGVSAPAVSKWETGSSCPDISLLCPIARALNTNVDTLLQFEQNIPEEELTLQCNQILELIHSGNYKSAKKKLDQLIHTYPNSPSVQYHAVVLLDSFLLFRPTASEQERQSWRNQKRELLQSLRTGQDSHYWERAVSGLISIALAEDNLTEAQSLLEELPDQSCDTKLLWAQLYLKRHEPQKALKMIQKRLFVLVRQTQTCLITMMNDELCLPPQQWLELCKAYSQLEETFGIANGSSSSLFFEAYHRLGDTQKAVEYLVSMIETYLSPIQAPNPAFFSAAGFPQKEQPYATMEMKKMLLKHLKEDEKLQPYRNCPEYEKALRQLSQTLDLTLD